MRRVTRLVTLRAAAAVGVAARLQGSRPPTRGSGRPGEPSAQDMGSMSGFRQSAPAGRSAPPPPTEESDTPPPPPQKPEGEPQFFLLEKAETGVVTLKLNRKPVNSLNLEFFNELNRWLLWLGYDEATKAIILTSNIGMVYSAGLDINELANPEPARFGEFWTQFQELWMILNTFPKPVIAAVNGNAPAGGCILALCADFRIMARAPEATPDKQYRIGLNETKLGIVAPPWVMGNFAYVVGQRRAERMLQLGETPTADEALAIGLVDRVVNEAELPTAAAAEAARFMTLPNEARWMSKDMMRRELFQHMSTEEERKYDVEFFTNMIQNPEVQANVTTYLKRLSGNKK